jgi:hypothetical protein
MKKRRRSLHRTAGKWWWRLGVYLGGVPRDWKRIKELERAKQQMDILGLSMQSRISGDRRYSLQLVHPYDGSPYLGTEVGALEGKLHSSLPTTRFHIKEPFYKGRKIGALMYLQFLRALQRRGYRYRLYPAEFHVRGFSGEREREMHRRFAAVEGTIVKTKPLETQAETKDFSELLEELGGREGKPTGLRPDEETLGMLNRLVRDMPRVTLVEWVRGQPRGANGYHILNVAGAGVSKFFGGELVGTQSFFIKTDEGYQVIPAAKASRLFELKPGTEVWRRNRIFYYIDLTPRSRALFWLYNRADDIIARMKGRLRK